jgi:hypothetical protein
MNFPVAVLQTLSAFVIFIAGYFLLFASIICALVLASSMYTGGRFLKAYAMRTSQAIEAESPVKGGCATIKLE